MAEFLQAIVDAMDAARGDLDRARSQGDVDDVILHEGRLEELRRLATAHGVDAA